MVNATLVILIICLLLFSVAISFLIILPIVIDKNLDNQLVLKEDSELLDKWSEIKLPIYVKFYFFNVTNPDDVEFRAKKPILKEIGPYTFIQKRTKNILKFENNGKEIVFKERRQYIFQRDQSVGSLEDGIHLPNIPKLIMASKAINDESEDAAVNYDIIDALFRELDSPLFENYTIEQFLFKGVDSELFQKMKNMLIGFNMTVPKDLDGKFGLLYKKNDTLDLQWQVGTGLGNSNLFQVKTWNKSRSLTFWKTEKCNQIKGSDGSGFHKHVNKNEKLFLFDPALCKPAELEFEKETKVKSVATYRFKLSEKVFASIGSHPENECYCTRPSKARDICSRDGFFDLSGCLSDAPIVLSGPHFLNGDVDLSDKIEDGLNPNLKKHETFIDIEPTTGSVINAAKRIQFNVEVFRNDSLEGFRDVQPMVLPFVWIEESIVLDDEMSDQFRTLNSVILYGKIIPISFIIFTSLGILLSTVSYLKRTGKINILDEDKKQAN